MTLWSSSVLLPGVDVGTQFECRSQFEVHGADQVVFGQKQQSLSVDFLGAKLLGYVLTPWREDGDRGLRHCATCIQGIN
ncbi:hypothetical protein EYF80_031724 [Liparis tanakae]|uniref:Uncharacterized protein n=1 Tax=Liparis tanakae TaxID=230148 RepID=A0A4Z2GZH5_9TELE|nr:hypothetical protein EYF80_031724 [Liparis tanakae]